LGKSYDNAIIEAEVSLAIERLLIGPSTATWDPSTGKINISSPPAGFVDLGAVVEDSPTLTVTREKYQLKLGLPKALQYEAIIGVDGEMTCTIYGKSNDVAKYATGTSIVSIGTQGTRIAYGKTTLSKFALLGVADFTDGTQVVHYFKEVSLKPEYTENIRPDEVGKLNVGFDAYSHISTIHGSERIVGERVYFK
jgi:hypothetical protein